MNKTAIKNFSIWARKKLIDDAAYRAGLVGITKDGITKPLPQSSNTVLFFDIGTATPHAISGDQIGKRNRLTERLEKKAAETDYATAYKYLLEEVAYTWFNRLIAIRFMEVNNYLPSGVRVLSSESGKQEPDLVTKPFDADLSFSAAEEQRILDLQRENATDELFQLLFLKQCDALHTILPGLFEKIGDDFELLFRVSVVDQDGVVYHLVHDIPEEDFDVTRGGQVEIIGWLYQYYNTEPKNEAFAKKEKVSKEEIPAVTQLFTPDWIVRYMVENSLGRLWLDREKAQSGLSDEYMNASYYGWKYYVEDAEQTLEVRAQLAVYRDTKKDLRPEDITFLDPCMGSGHILVYAFDVFMDIYKSMGWSERDAAQRIIQVNLYGLDIDERARQLAYFSLMMKARQYDRRFFTSNLQPNVFSAKGYPEGEEYGSLITVDELEPAPDYDNWRIEDGDYHVALNRWSFRYVLSQKYDVVVTNPPYMGSGGMTQSLFGFIRNRFPESFSDLFAVFMEKSFDLAKYDGYIAMVTPQSWMFLSSYIKLRNRIFATKCIQTLSNLGLHAFDGGFGTSSWCIHNRPIMGFVGSYISLDSYSSSEEKEEVLRTSPIIYHHKSDLFLSLPNQVVAYWCSPAMASVFMNSQLIKDVYSLESGIKTGKNELLLRTWPEVSASNTCFSSINSETLSDPSIVWFKCNKAGGFEKWYGSFQYVIKMGQHGKFIKEIVSRDIYRLRDEANYSKAGLTWPHVGDVKYSCKYLPRDVLNDVAADAIYSDHDEADYTLIGFFNSVVFNSMLKMINPTVNYPLDTIGNAHCIPLAPHCSEHVTAIVKDCIDISKIDWDSFEASWDFKTHPLIAVRQDIACGHFSPAKMEEANQLCRCFEAMAMQWGMRFDKLKANEEELNRIFIDIYGLQDELTPEVEDKDVTVRKADLRRDVRSLISYAVGCMFGRYSHYTEGLLFAGGTWDFDAIYERLNEAARPTDIEPWAPNALFLPDSDNVIPITDEEYLEDDITSRFCSYIRTVYGEENWEQNLDFIANVLGNKGNSNREVIRNYFLNDFFNDHCQTYSVSGSGKRPIYWLFDSGKQNGFKALIYLHRYTPDTIGTVRVDYLHRLQHIYECEIDRMQDTIDNSMDKREVAAAAKRKEKLTKQLKECRDYDQKLAHLALSRIELDLDDGVKKNYRKLQTAADGKFYEVLAQSKNIMAKE